MIQRLIFDFLIKISINITIIIAELINIFQKKKMDAVEVDISMPISVLCNNKIEVVLYNLFVEACPII